MTTIAINKRGSLTLPQSLRRALGIDKGGVVMADLEHGAIVLRPAVAFPIEIYTDERMAEFDQADEELRKAMHARRPKKR